MVWRENMAVSSRSDVVQSSGLVAQARSPMGPRSSVYQRPSGVVVQTSFTMLGV
jgi:hypothetical protein